MLDRVMQCAENAKNYARSKIVKGSTHVDGIAYAQYSSIDEKGALHEGVKDMREFTAQKYLTSNLLEEHSTLLNDYEAKIEISTKFTLGNCYEFALHAFDYVINNDPDIYAEVMNIMRGDHYFIVLNRREGSNIRDPLTWGDDAVICDPWLNKCYPAKDYRAGLGVEFQPEKNHQLTNWSCLTSDTIFAVRTIDNLKKNFLQQVKLLVATLTECRDALIMDKNELERLGKEGYTIFRKTQSMKDFITRLQKLDCKEYDASDDYREVKEKLLEKLELLRQEAQLVVRFSPEDKKSLGLFKKASEIPAQAALSIVDETNEKLAKLKIL